MDKVLNTEKAIAYFTASWCMPCQKIKPEYAKAGMQDNSHIYFVIDVDNIAKEYLEEYNIKSIPTLIQMEHGKELKRINSRIASEIIKEVNS
jgi:thiol-disulfide isomerase/thioredoxin